MTRYAVCILLMIATSCETKFDKETWLENKNSGHDNPRFDMVDDLRNNQLKSGMTRKEVVNLLGLPHYDTADNAFEYQYEIGSNPGMHIDPYFFIVEFDSNGRLFNTRVEEH